MKKIFLGLILIVLSSIIFINKAELLGLVSYIEKEKNIYPLAVAGILIGLKAISAPLGFPGAPLTLLSGSLFGNYLGIVISIIGNTLGACMAFLLSRYLLRDYVQKKILIRYPKIKKYEKEMKRNELTTVIVLRLIPLFPFNALNFILGITSISFKNYFLGSAIGMIPGTVLFVYFGSSLKMLDLSRISLSLGGIILLIYLGRFYEKRSSSI